MNTLKIALLGAESTGKTTLAQALLEHFGTSNIAVTVVPEMLREFCTRENRVPLAHEQRALMLAQIDAEEQTENQAHSPAKKAQLIICDSAPITTAIYSSLYFSDDSLFEIALAHHHQYTTSLVMATDIAWQADPLPFMRDGITAQAQFEQRLQSWLKTTSISHEQIDGAGPLRFERALSAIMRFIR